MEVLREEFYRRERGIVVEGYSAMLQAGFAIELNRFCRGTNSFIAL